VCTRGKSARSPSQGRTSEVDEGRWTVETIGGVLEGGMRQDVRRVD